MWHTCYRSRGCKSLIHALSQNFPVFDNRENCSHQNRVIIRFRQQHAWPIKRLKLYLRTRMYYSARADLTCDRCSGHRAKVISREHNLTLAAAALHGSDRQPTTRQSDRHDAQVWHVWGCLHKSQTRRTKISDAEDRPITLADSVNVIDRFSASAICVLRPTTYVNGL